MHTNLYISFVTKKGSLLLVLLLKWFKPKFSFVIWKINGGYVTTMNLQTAKRGILSISEKSLF